MTKFISIFALATLVGCSDAKDDDTASDGEATEESETAEEEEEEEEEEESIDCTYNGFEAEFVSAYYNEDGWYLSLIHISEPTRPY